MTKSTAAIIANTTEEIFEYVSNGQKDKLTKFLSLLPDLNIIKSGCCICRICMDSNR